MAACAQIETSGAEYVVINAIEVAPGDFAWLNENWHLFYPTQYIQWMDELVADPSTPGTPWIGWRKAPAATTWYNPEYIPPEEPPAP